MAYDRFRGERTTATTISYLAELECIYLLSYLPWEMIVFWKDYESQRNQIQLVPSADITLDPELNVTHSTRI